ncbi:hypothetical protein [Bacillus sp. UNC438CL73TsuS30]|uniref:hypothetical protein n=1 Tax=Bacillus sp. UNC438CL73TsuS30 TaxID=1340434 RepID=UPI00047AE60E|nr:hypothetical protein [Bacillus sp. UNC438CL73TsuS30]
MSKKVIALVDIHISHGDSLHPFYKCKNHATPIKVDFSKNPVENYFKKAVSNLVVDFRSRILAPSAPINAV